MSQGMRDQNEDVLCSSDVASHIVDYDSADADSQLLYAESHKRAAGLTGWEEYSSSATRPAAEGRGDGVVPGVLTCSVAVSAQVTCSVAVSASLAVEASGEETEDENENYQTLPNPSSTTSTYATNKTNSDATATTALFTAIATETASQIQLSSAGLQNNVASSFSSQVKRCSSNNNGVTCTEEVPEPPAMLAIRESAFAGLGALGDGGEEETMEPENQFHEIASTASTAKRCSSSAAAAALARTTADATSPKLEALCSEEMEKGGDKCGEIGVGGSRFTKEKSVQENEEYEEKMECYAGFEQLMPCSAENLGGGDSHTHFHSPKPEQKRADSAAVAAADEIESSDEDPSSPILMTKKMTSVSIPMLPPAPAQQQDTIYVRSLHEAKVPLDEGVLSKEQFITEKALRQCDARMVLELRVQKGAQPAPPSKEIDKSTAPASSAPAILLAQQPNALQRTATHFNITLHRPATAPPLAQQPSQQDVPAAAKEKGCGCVWACVCESGVAVQQQGNANAILPRHTGVCRVSECLIYSAASYRNVHSIHYENTPHISVSAG